MSNRAQYDLIRASGLFDSEFYSRTYGRGLPDGEDPLQHFLEVGWAHGHLPSPDFDPVLYRVLLPECRDTNPLVHQVRSGAPFKPPPLPEVFPEVASILSAENPKVDPEFERNRVYAKDAAKAQAIPFDVKGHRYALTIPEPEALLERLHSGRPFAYARLPHGFWDALWMLATAERGIAAHELGRELSPVQRRALARRLCASIRPNHGAFIPFFMDEVLADIPVHAGHPDFFRSVSFKGYPTHDESVYDRVMPPGDAVLSLFAEHFQPDEAIYDGTQWKRLLIAGYLRELPAICRGRPVVLVASPLFAELGTRWKLDDFSLIDIPPVLSQWLRGELLARISNAVTAACARTGRSPIVITRCGGSLAYWLITRLFHRVPQAFYLDLGQTLNAWFFDVLKFTPWMRVYARTVISNCTLEAYYHARMGARYEELLDTLSDPAATRRDSRDAGLARAKRAGTHDGGKMQTAAGEDEIIDARTLVDTIRTRRPALFDMGVTDATASALLMQAIQVIRERLNDAPDGQVKIKGLGTFRIRHVERREGEARVVRKVINVLVNQKDTEVP